MRVTPVSGWRRHRRLICRKDCATLRFLTLLRARAELRALQRGNPSLLIDARVREPTDRKEEAAAGKAFEAADAAIERLGREVAQCERALQRLDQERHGDCVDCGESIAWARLMAQPSAERCAACQHTFENLSHGTARA